MLGNLTIENLDYELLLREYNLIPWIKGKLQPGAFTSHTVIESGIIDKIMAV